MNETWRGFVWMLVGVGLTLVTDGFGTFKAVKTRAKVPPAVDVTPAPAKDEGAQSAEPTFEVEVISDEQTKYIESEPRQRPVDLRELKAQIAELERLLRDRKERETRRVGNEGEKLRTPGSVEGDLAEMLKRQNEPAPGGGSPRAQQSDHEVQLQALEMVQKLRLEIESSTAERDRRLKEIMESNR